MKTSRALLAVWAAAALLAVASPACTGSTPGNPGGGSPDGGGNGGGGGGGGGDGGPDGGSGNGSDGGSVLACVLPGASCVSGMPCCSGICDGTVCAVAEFCQANGQSCTTNTDCCLNSCVNGTCSDQICKDVGKSCGTGQECCTGTCTGGTCATLPGGSCNVIGQTCSTGSDCCSTNCQGGFCARAYSCQAVDDICRSDDECCGHACSANDGGVGHCLEVTGGTLAMQSMREHQAEQKQGEPRETGQLRSPRAGSRQGCGRPVREHGVIIASPVEVVSSPPGPPLVATPPPNPPDFCALGNIGRIRVRRAADE